MEHPTDGIENCVLGIALSGYRIMDSDNQLATPNKIAGYRFPLLVVEFTFLSDVID